jgi:peptide/nickel transport system permease protein
LKPVLEGVNAEKPVTLVSKKYAKRSQMAEIWRRMKRNKGAMLGFAILVMLIFVALFADLLVDYETQVIGQNIAQRMQPPSREHLFGTDELGRDTFCRLLYGTRYSLSVGLAAVLIGLTVGVPLGAIAGYFGGSIEDIIMRITDMLLAIPNILLGIVVVSALGANTINLMIAIGICSVPHFVRITRATVLTIRNQEYIEASRAIGLSEAKIIFAHVLPNCVSLIIVQTTLRVATAIISASSLSFLGLGVPAPAPEWGAMLSIGRKYVRTNSYLTLFPGLAIMITVLSINMIGDALRDAMDPKLKK